jgi:hypothetical protein
VDHPRGGDAFKSHLDLWIWSSSDGVHVHADAVLHFVTVTVTAMFVEIVSPHTSAIASFLISEQTRQETLDAFCWIMMKRY